MERVCEGALSLHHCCGTDAKERTGACAANAQLIALAPLRSYASAASAAAAVAGNTLHELEPGRPWHDWVLASLVDAGRVTKAEAASGSLLAEPTHWPHRHWYATHQAEARLRL